MSWSSHSLSSFLLEALAESTMEEQGCPTQHTVDVTAVPGQLWLNLGMLCPAALFHLHLFQDALQFSA